MHKQASTNSPKRRRHNQQPNINQVINVTRYYPCPDLEKDAGCGVYWSVGRHSSLDKLYFRTK